MSVLLTRSKILKPADATVEPLEQKLAECLIDLEASQSDFRAELRSFHFYSVSEVDVISGRKALVVYVPVVQLKVVRKIGQKLIQELEKKFSDKHVVIIGKRKIIPKAKRTAPLANQQRPYSRTLTSVHERMLDDIVSPFDIIGKRIRVRRDGTHLMKVLLDPKDRTMLEAKVDTFASVYRKLTGKDIAFEFPTNVLIV